MKFVALIGLIDEADCIGTCIDYHLAIGFDHIVVTDIGSTDGSIEIVKDRIAATSRVSLLHAGLDLRSTNWPGRMLEFAVTELKPDYVAHIDPDEFWIPYGGTLASLRDPGQADVMSVRRYNAVQNVDEVVNGRQLDPARFREQIVYIERAPVDANSPIGTPIYSGAIGPKVMHRGVGAQLSLGHHSVASPQLKTQVVPEDLLILHFPISSYAKFEQKYRNAAATLAANPQMHPTAAWHWRRLAKAIEQGTLDEEYRHQLFNTEQIERLSTLGRVGPLEGVFARRA
ncbi:glycosyltransferase family 2 protein [Rhizobium sp. SIMBA_035]|jgi:hypothetical protein